jgi:hypothetical protein
MRLNKTALAAVATALLIGCTQASIETPSIDSSAAAKTLADAAFGDANAAFAFAYTVTGTNTTHPGLSIDGSSPPPTGTVYTFNETVTMTDYDSTGTAGIFATGDVVMTGKYDSSGTTATTYTYVGDLVMSGTNGNGHVVLSLTLKRSGTVTSYSGTATVAGTEYTYSGSE